VLARYLCALSDPALGTKGADHAEDGADAMTATLTVRQRDVLRLLAKGYTNKAMAQELALSEPTVKMHLSALRRVFRASNRTEILVKALNLGLHSF
jgi:two-component system, NarL family, nitrate/nitrite response regulator NarL